VSLSLRIIPAAARNSPLSKAQVQEVWSELKQYDPDVTFETIWLETTGDKDQITSLRTLDKTDFFTKEVDEMLLQNKCRIGIHSAKDLPEPLTKGLVIVALTRGIDPSDVLVFRRNEQLSSLPKGAKIGTSSERREKTIRELRPDLICVDIRGNIQKRLELLDSGAFDGVVMAEAALRRLGIHRERLFLPGPSAPLQGRLAVIAREGDVEMKDLFACIDGR
jgi:hydroxymethylbilane synthase